MATQQNMILKVSADTTEVTKGIEQVGEQVENTDSAVSGLTGQLDKMTGGAVTGFKNFTSGVKTGVLGLKSFKVALAATGIGLILVALGSLVSFFTSTKKGAEQLKVATAALGTAFDVVKDRISKIGGALVKFFSGDFSGALEDVQGSFEGITEEIVKETKAAIDLERAMNALKDQERDFIKVRAETNKQIAEARLLAEDETLSAEARLKALQKAVDLERETVAEQLRLAEERARIAREQVALGESLEEDLQKVAEAEAAVIDLQTASLRTQKRLTTELNSLKLEAINLTRNQLKAEIDLANETVKGMEARKKAEKGGLEVTQEIAEATLQVNQTSLLSQVDLTESAEQEKIRIRRETFEDFKNNAELAAHQGLEFASLSLQAIGALSEAFTKDDEKRAKRTFEIGKKLALVQAIMNTAEGVTAALTDKTQPSTILRILQTAAVATAGAAQIATIKRQQFKAGGSTPPRPSAGSRGVGEAAGNISQSPQLDLGFLGAGSGQSGFRSYVIASEVSNSQQANQRINDQASLVG